MFLSLYYLGNPFDLDCESGLLRFQSQKKCHHINHIKWNIAADAASICFGFLSFYLFF